MVAMSSFFMPITAWNARSRAAVSLEAIHSAMRLGTTCQETPKRSFSQPHGP
jgi:hypothetical protein